MKKKASLLISGITTVAMLAVAVGSFAAWDTLSASATGLQVSTSTPTTITAVKNADVSSDGKALIPADGTSVVLNKTNASDKVKIGAIKISAKGLPASDSKVVFEPKIEKTEGNDITDKFKVTLKPASGTEIEKGVNITGLSDTETSFDVYVAFADNADSADINQYGSLDDLTVKIDVTASNTVTP